MPPQGELDGALADFDFPKSDQASAHDVGIGGSSGSAGGKHSTSMSLAS